MSLINVLEGLFILAFFFADRTGNGHVIQTNISIFSFFVLSLLHILMTGSTHHDMEARQVGHRGLVVETNFAFLLFVIFVDFLLFGPLFILFFFSFFFLSLFVVRLKGRGFGAVVIRTFGVFGIEIVAGGAVVEFKFNFAVGAVLLPGFVGFIILNLNLCETLVTAKGKVVFLAFGIDTNSHGLSGLFAKMVVISRAVAA